MKSKLFLVFAIISVFGFSQQVLKKIKDTPNYTVVDLYSFANGTSSGNVVGNNNFDEVWTAGEGYIVFGNFTGTSTYSANSVTYNINLSEIDDVPNVENLCNGNFQYSNITYGLMNNFTSDQDGTTIFNIKAYYAASKRDETTDNNTLTDLYHIQFIIPKLLNDNSAIPVNTLVSCVSPKPFFVGALAGQDFHEGTVLLRFNGTTWVTQPTFPSGNTVPVLQDVCSSILSVSEIDGTESKISVFPNPAFDFINLESKNGTINIAQVFDMNGKLVKTIRPHSDKVQFSVEELPSGIYFVKVRTDKNSQTLKVIKK